MASLSIYLCCPLAVPENSENEGDALLHFTAEFSTRSVNHRVLLMLF